MAMAPQIQHYLSRALVEDSPAINKMLDDVMDLTERFLADFFPSRFSEGTARVRDAAAVMTAINTSTIVLQSQLARRMGVASFSEDALTRIGLTTLDVWEAVAEFTGMDFWRDLRNAIDPSSARDKESAT